MKPCIVDSTKTINSVSKGTNEIQLLVRYIRYLWGQDWLTLVPYKVHSLMDTFLELRHFEICPLFWGLPIIQVFKSSLSPCRKLVISEISAFNQNQWTWWASSKFRLKKLTEMQKTPSHKPCYHTQQLIMPQEQLFSPNLC